jgi:hypothetical protein
MSKKHSPTRRRMSTLPTNPSESTKGADDIRAAATSHFRILLSFFYSTGTCTCWSISTACPAGWQYTGGIETKDVIASVAENLVDLGVPKRFQSDREPQFRAEAYQQFLRRWGVAPAPSSPHYPQGNGHAVAAVKVMEILILKLAPTGEFSCEAFSQGLLENAIRPEKLDHPRPRSSSATTCV